MTKNARLIDLTGKTFGRWTVVSKGGNTKGGGALWACLCACGTERIVLGADLRNGKSVSCGCFRADATRQTFKTHGAAGTRLYRIWLGMRERCANPDSDPDGVYFAKGITVCDEWQSFEPFRDWALQNGYADTLSIDRKENSLGYSPDNCRWATAVVQANNRGLVRKMPDGRSAHDVAKENGISMYAYKQRVVAGWPLEEAVTHPHGKRRAPGKKDELGRFC